MISTDFIGGEQTFKQTLSLRVALGVLLFLPILLLWSLAPDPSPYANPILFAVAAGLAVVYAAVCIIIGSNRVIFSDLGIRRESILGVIEVPWAQVVEIRDVELPVNVGAHFGIIGLAMAATIRSSKRTQIKLTVISSDGKRLKITSHLQRIKEATNIILGRVLPPLLETARASLRRGETLKFGPIAISQTVLSWKSKPGVPFSELESAEIVSSNLKIKRKGKWGSLVSVRSDKIPNAFVLLELLQESAPHLRQKFDPLAHVRR